jgi:Heavy metal associated domain 2
MAWLLHELPGRLRAREPAIKGHPARAAALAADLRKLPGVIWVSANALTGSVVVEHHGARSAIFGVLGIGPESASAVSTPPPMSGPLEAFAAWVAERLLERALRAAVAALI